jgi:dipeptidyl aminopeptidase/acylaminoacyl peptidase
MTLLRSLPSAAALAALCAAPLHAHAQSPAQVQVQAQAAPALPPVESFFENPTFGGAMLSPSGRYLAARTGGPGRHDVLTVIDLETNQLKVVASFSAADVDDFQWVNDERLVFTVTDKALGQGEVWYGPGLFAVNRDGTRPLQLASRQGEAYVGERASGAAHKPLPWHTYALHQQGPRDSEYIWATSPEFDDDGHVKFVNLLRLNTISGKASTVQRPGRVDQWMLDQKGEPRLALGSERDKSTMYYRDPASGDWRVLSTWSTYKGGHGAMTPLGFGADGTLYVVARAQGDTSAVHTFDFKSGKINPEPLIVTEGYDFDGRLLYNQDKILGLRLRTDATVNVWLDPDMKALQQQVDKALPSTNNLISVPSQGGAPWVLVQSYSDVVPATWSLFNTRTGRLNKVGDSHPHIDPAQMASQDLVRYKARDGLEIPALLTLPRNAGGKNLPLVVLVHGGPWVRGHSWGWSAQSQFLASRGYAVLEPEYRGSLGFGAKHYMAGWKQWGLAMQDDLADGVRWAAAQGIVDPKRVCIAGASYGGYATLMGLANDPGLYQCGIDWAGVTDINLMYTGTWVGDSDLSDDYKQYGMPEMIGDRVKDAAQLKATSPIEQAARITRPLLLAYGGADRRVPMFHGRKFYDAVKSTNPNVEWVVYPEEGHGWVLEKNNYDFWTRVEKFLDRHIGKGAVKE